MRAAGGALLGNRSRHSAQSAPAGGFLGTVYTGKEPDQRDSRFRLCAPSGATQYSKRAVLANSPNSIPPERVFSCLNNFFTPGHENSYSDYIEYATQLQFNHNQST